MKRARVHRLRIGRTKSPIVRMFKILEDRIIIVEKKDGSVYACPTLKTAIRVIPPRP